MSSINGAIVRYEQVKPITRQEAEKIFEGNQPDEVADALLRLTYHHPDFEWIQEKCVIFLESPHENVRWRAIQCLGHLARIHGKIGDKVVNLLEEFLHHPVYAGVASDALDDIQTFAKDV